MRWPFGPLHLALNPPYLFFVLFLFFGYFFFGGFKGQVRWPNPPCLFFCFVFVLFFGVIFLYLTWP